MKILLNYQFTDLNKYINLERTNKYLASSLKKTETNFASLMLKKYSLHIQKIKKPLKLKFYWHVKNKRKDLDNLAWSKKFIIDGLVKSKCLENDGQKHINAFEDVIVYDSTDSVEIEFIENYKTEKIDAT